MKSFFLAARPKTLLVSIAPPLVSFFYANKYHEVPLYLLFCTVFAGMMIQLATNFFNDLIDHEKGADSIRLGPVRVSASGLVSQKTIKTWAFWSLGISVVLSIPLIYRGGPVILLLGLVSIYLSYGYTGGILSLAYRGLGELFVFLFFGLFSFLGSLYIYTYEFNSIGLSLASQFGLLAVTFIGINNLRDREQDKKVNKLTLATRMSGDSYKFLIMVSILGPYLLSFMTFLKPGIIQCGLLVGIPFSLYLYRWKGSELNTGLKVAAVHLTLFSILTILEIKNGSLF